MAEGNTSKPDGDVVDGGTATGDKSHSDAGSMNVAAEAKDTLMAEGMHHLSVNKDSGVSLQSSTNDDASLADDSAQTQRMFGKSPSDKKQAIRRRHHDDSPEADENDESSSLGFFDMDTEEVNSSGNS